MHEHSDEQSSTVDTPAAETQSHVAQGEKLPVTPANSRIEFIGSNPRETNHSSFGKFAGQIELVGERPESSKVSVEIEMNLVDTNERKLTAHLQSADFFDVAKSPKATFVSTEIKPAVNGVQRTRSPGI